VSDKPKPQCKTSPQGTTAIDHQDMPVPLRLQRLSDQWVVLEALDRRYLATEARLATIILKDGFYDLDIFARLRQLQMLVAKIRHT
jgi:hypothetical protein